MKTLYFQRNNIQNNNVNYKTKLFKDLAEISSTSIFKLIKKKTKSNLIQFIQLFQTIFGPVMKDLPSEITYLVI